MSICIYCAARVKEGNCCHPCFEAKYYAAKGGYQVQPVKSVADEILEECFQSKAKHDLQAILTKHRMDVIFNRVGYHQFLIELMEWHNANK